MEVRFLSRIILLKKFLCLITARLMFMPYSQIKTITAIKIDCDIRKKRIDIAKIIKNDLLVEIV
jgi:hypothetical protein